MKQIDITISEVYEAAQIICDEKYIERARGIAANGFIDGAVWVIQELKRREGATWIES